MTATGGGKMTATASSSSSPPRRPSAPAAAGGRNEACRFDKPSPSYAAIRHLFRAATDTFYPTIGVAGLSNVPPVGNPTLLCFNHGNSLVDATMVLSRTPRTVHLCAKDTLWSIPIFGRLVAGVGTIPVYRRAEHGDRASGLNNAESGGMYAAVLKALEGGGMVGLAPEGTSKFAPHMSTPLRTGVVRIALASVKANVSRGGDPAYRVSLLPAGLTYTNREKFRSDAVVAFGEPLVVDASCLPGEDEDEEMAVRKLIRSLTERLERVTVNFEDWETADLALVAALIHRSRGKEGGESTACGGRDLVQFVRDLRAWARVLNCSVESSNEAWTGNPKCGNSNGSADITLLRRKLLDYRKALDVCGISDETVQLTLSAADGHQEYAHDRVMALALNVCKGVFLLFLALPTIILWAPTAFLIRQQETYLLSKGRTWVDSIAEVKMLNGLISILVHLAVCAVFGWWKAFWLLLPCTWISMRLYEEGVAAGRRAYQFWRLGRIPSAQRKSIAMQRRHCEEALDAHSFMFREERKHTYACCDSTRVLAFSFLRRRKKENWIEILRFKGCPTLDYIN